MRTPAQSPMAQHTLTLVEGLQRRLVDALEAIGVGTFEPVEWARDGGRHGGGVRYVLMDTPIIDRASVNVSQVHYDDLPDKRLSSATALSTIIHPIVPLAPSMHMHISWTQMRDGKGYWRVMADLNPTIEIPEATTRFSEALKHAAGDTYTEACAQGDRYFFIPALNRHRGTTHFYLESYSTPDSQADEALAVAVGNAVSDLYPALVKEALDQVVTPEAIAAQIAYHTLYLFQVLTLDRGTTSGLLVHHQNDVGILGSLPSQVDTALLRTWRTAMPKPQTELLDGIVAALEDGGTPGVRPVTVPMKHTLAQVLRDHYAAYPQALTLQASGNVIPPTVANHH